MKPALVDISVLLVFFTRHKQFKRVFEQVRKARPSRLFLYQDGPREGKDDDIENILKCRSIAENIDWDCDVHRLYQENNYGCDPSGYYAHTWAFSQTDKCIVIEDDDVPSVSFFRFCKVLLDKYENDERIMLITGLNTDGETSYCPYDYFFSSTTFTVGCWASWKRVVDKWDKNYNFLDNPYYSKLVKEYISQKKLSPGFLPSCIAHKQSEKEHFETIMISNQYLNNGLTIVPKKNMVINIGLTEDATHTSFGLNCLPKGYRRIFELPIYELEENIKLQENIIEDFSYKRRSYKVYGWGNIIIKIFRSIETTIYLIREGEFKYLAKDLKSKAKKLINHRLS